MCLALSREQTVRGAGRARGCGCADFAITRVPAGTVEPEARRVHALWDLLGIWMAVAAAGREPRLRRTPAYSRAILPSSARAMTIRWISDVPS